jgi:carbon monoxide dehydrogenase subunit G
MISISESTTLSATPQDVWRWLENLDSHYLSLHSEHLVWRTLKGSPLREGSIWFADEWIGDRRISGRFEVVSADEGRYFSYRALGFASIVNVGGSFELVPLGAKQTSLNQEVHLGWRIPILDPLLRLAIPGREIRRHMREEQMNIGRALARR